MSTSCQVFALLVVALFTIFRSTSSIQDQEDTDGFNTTYEVHVINGLKNNTNPLIIHCQSKDDDLGYHTLNVGQEFYWHFKVNFWGTTLFFCRMRWGQKDTSFDVFKADKKSYNCLPSGKCYWKVAEDGFYFSGNNTNHYVKRLPWP